jgi:hypothetical protein
MMIDWTCRPYNMESPVRISPILIFILLAAFACTKNKTNPFTPSGIGEGLCVYPAVLKTDGAPVWDSYDLTLAEISGRPIVSYRDILSYDTVSHVLHLSVPRDSLHLFNRFGTPFLVTLDSAKMYGGWFFADFASSVRNSVVIIADDFTVAESNAIRISLGYPDERFFTGADPRGNPSIIRRLIHDSKVITQSEKQVDNTKSN